MKNGSKWFSTLCLIFFLWLLLFPPWMQLSGRFIGGLSHPRISLGHHWRFSPPLHWAWEWSQDAHAWQWSWYPNLAAQIDYQQMLYEAVLGLVVLALLFLLVPTLRTPIRKITGGAKRVFSR